ncbi:hypothetical protein NL108_015874 [Boleophthalmus pectinirostris]|nr:hypothetical protein NL108_015874 [Boleophthalmus pectinirostris]
MCLASPTVETVVFGFAPNISVHCMTFIISDENIKIQYNSSVFFYFYTFITSDTLQFIIKCHLTEVPSFQHKLRQLENITFKQILQSLLKIIIIIIIIMHQFHVALFWTLKDAQIYRALFIHSIPGADKILL